VATSLSFALSDSFNRAWTERIPLMDEDPDFFERDPHGWAVYMDSLDHTPRSHAGRAAEAEAIDHQRLSVSCP
jgi:hypothetical protein